MHTNYGELQFKPNSNTDWSDTKVNIDMQIFINNNEIINFTKLIFNL